MSTPMFNSQRGVPYEPGAAGAHREREALRTARELDRIARADAKRRKARYLDEVEHAHRERRQRGKRK